MNARILTRAECEPPPPQPSNGLVPRTNRRSRTVVITEKGRAYLAKMEGK